MVVQYNHIVQHMMVKFFKYPMITYLLMTKNKWLPIGNVTEIVHFTQYIVKGF